MRNSRDASAFSLGAGSAAGLASPRGLLVPGRRKMYECKEDLAPVSIPINSQPSAPSSLSPASRLSLPNWARELRVKTRYSHVVGLAGPDAIGPKPPGKPPPPP